MSSEKALAVYLTDHMAGSVSASDLAKRGAKHNDGQVSRFFADLAREIEADRRMLRSVADRVGTQPSLLKQAGAVAAERLSRFKIDHRVTGSPQLSLLLELELLYLGIEGKHTLWRTLRSLSGSDARLAEFDFDELARRAAEQLEAVEGQRLAAAATALAGCQEQAERSPDGLVAACQGQRAGAQT
jgi:hypothetical protein